MFSFANMVVASLFWVLLHALDDRVHWTLTGRSLPRN
jgi:hypothetical protein